MNRRIKHLRIDRDLLVAMFRQDCEKQIVFDGMPEDAKIVGISESVYFLKDEIGLKVESASFPELGEGESIPELKITVMEVRPEIRRIRER